MKSGPYFARVSSALYRQRIEQRRGFDPAHHEGLQRVNQGGMTTGLVPDNISDSPDRGIKKRLGSGFEGQDTLSIS